MGLDFPRRSRLPRALGVFVALIAAGFVLAGCQEVPSNLVKSEPFQLEPIEGTDIQRVKLADRTAERIDLQTAEVTASGTDTLVPHAAIIYNPLGEVFVYTKPEPRTYVRAAVTVARVEGDLVVLAAGPPAGTVVVTVGAAELLATEYEILNQHP